MEKLELVCPETGHPTGVCLSRDEAIRSQAWCRSTNIFVVNGKGEILCHQRSKIKERLPGVWCTHFGGHVAEHETYESNALKELEEEAGIRLEPRRLVSWRTTRMDGPRLWVREFVALYDIAASALTAQQGEVDAFAWMSFEEIQQNEKTNPEAWCVGTQDFRIEYYCLRAALTAAHGLGAFEAPPNLRSWTTAA